MDVTSPVKFPILAVVDDCKFATSVVDDTTKGAVPVATSDVKLLALKLKVPISRSSLATRILIPASSKFKYEVVPFFISKLLSSKFKVLPAFKVRLEFAMLVMI